MHFAHHHSAERLKLLYRHDFTGHFDGTSSFQDVKPNICDEFSDNWVCYLREKKTATSESAVDGITPEAKNVKNTKAPFLLDITEGGYPILPTLLPEETLNHKKALIRAFATYHYRKLIFLVLCRPTFIHLLKDLHRGIRGSEFLGAGSHQDFKSSSKTSICLMMSDFASHPT